MANTFVNIAIYQIDSDNLFNNNPPFPVFMDFPASGLHIREVSPPLNTTRGVSCYGAMKSWAHGKHEYFTNLTMAEIVVLANAASPDDGEWLLTEDGDAILTEDSEKILVEDMSMLAPLFDSRNASGQPLQQKTKKSWWGRFMEWCAKVLNKINPFKKNKMKKQILTILAVIFSLVSFSQGIKISALPEYSSPGDAGYVPAVVGGVTYKILPTNLLQTTLALKAKLAGGNSFTGQQNFADPIRIGTTATIDARIGILMKDNTSPSGQSFSALVLKGATDIADLNMNSGVMVKHDDQYDLTGGYAGALQVYHEAKGYGGMVVGDNNFVRADTMTLGNYDPTYDDIANGFVAIELGPLQPKSEKFRWNNRGDAIFGWNNIRDYVASQSGITITDPVNSFFPSDVGKWFVWSNQDVGGRARFADRIIGYTDANHITVETSRTISSQGGRVASAWAYVDTIGNARFRIGHVDSLRIGTDAAYYRFVPSAASLKLLRVGSSTPDTLFDVSGTSRLLTGRDIELNGSHYSKITWKNSTTTLFDITADVNSTVIKGRTSAPIEFQFDGIAASKITTTKHQLYKPVIISGSDDTPLGKLDVRNPDANISAYIDNTRGTGTNFGLLVDVTASATENRAGYFTASGSAADKAIMIPSSTGTGAGDRAISNESTAPIYSVGLVKTDSKFQAINSPVGSSASDSVAKINRSTGDIEQVKLDTATINSAGNTALNARAPIASPTFTGTVVLPSTTTIGSVPYASLSVNEKLTAYAALGSSIKGESIISNIREMTTTFTMADALAFYVAMEPLLVAQTITGVMFYQTTQGNFTGDANNEVGLYTYSGGTLTRVAVSANNANIWKGTGGTVQTVAFGTPYAAAANTIYYVGIIYNNSAQTTAPVIGAAAGLSATAVLAADFTNSAKLSGSKSAEANLPSTQVMSGLSNNGNRIWLAYY